MPSPAEQNLGVETALVEDPLDATIEHNHAVVVVFVRTVNGIPHVLLAERPTKKGHETVLPGGKAEGKEKIFDVGMREAKEEIGLPEEHLAVLREQGQVKLIGATDLGYDRKGQPLKVSALLVNYPEPGEGVHEPYPAKHPRYGMRELTNCTWKPLSSTLKELNAKLSSTEGSELNFNDEITRLALVGAQLAYRVHFSSQKPREHARRT